MKAFYFSALVLLSCKFVCGQEPDVPPENNEVYPKAAGSGTEASPLQQPAESCTCGERQADGENRIMNGRETEPHEFPWRVALYMRSFIFPYSFFCGASILNERWILTAAHCVEGYKDVSLPWNPMVVVAGAHDLRKSEDSTRQIRAVYFTNMHVHPGYSPITHNNDIALLELKVPLNITKAVSPGCLPYKFQSKEFTHEKVVASGWGVTGEKKNDPAKENMAVTLDLITNKECQDLYDTNTKGSVEIQDEMICTYTYSTTEEGKDACQGDSGGSIDYQDPSNSLYYLLGIVSFGEGCGRENRPGAYARVTKLLDFIEKTTNNAPFCKK